MIMTTLPKKCNPCIDCPDRKVGCHGKCDKYKKFKDKMNKMRKEERSYHSIRSYRTAKIYQNGYSVKKNRKKSTLKSINKS